MGLVITLSVHLLIRVPISPREMDGISTIRPLGAARLGGCHVQSNARPDRQWLALITMLGLLALVIATSRTPCVPYGLWPTLQMQCR